MESIFNNSKYTKWYNIIINKSTNRVLTGYLETHHVIPKSLGGSNEQKNLVKYRPTGDAGRCQPALPRSHHRFRVRLSRRRSRIVNLAPPWRPRPGLPGVGRRRARRPRLHLGPQS